MGTRKRNRSRPPEVSVCEWSPSSARRETASVRVHRHRGDFSWSGVRVESYKSGRGSWLSVARQVLVGACGEKTRFHVRYFEVGPRGFTSLERHRHEHVVIVVRGRGRVLMNRRRIAVGFLDTVFIGPDVPHQLRNPFGEPFGFLCIVNARRDRPVLIDEQP